MSEETTPSIEFLAAAPKSDLHVHLDGSVRIPTLIELAREYRIELPSYTEAGLRELVFKPRYQSLSEYLAGFPYLVGVLQSESALERAAYELAVDNQAEGVRYVEPRFAPQLHVHRYLSTLHVLKAVDRGLRRARDEFNRRPEVTSGAEPPFGYGIIVCALRMFKSSFSEYYANLIGAHEFARPREVYGLASHELVRAAIHARDQHGLPIVGFDLAGEEAGYPPEDHRVAYAYAHRNFLMKTVHAGEAWGPESIFQAITELHADRIGHATWLLNADRVTDPDIADREAYVQRLGQYIADRRITLEVCLTSNLQTVPTMRDVSDHTFHKLWDARLSATLCTDNRTVSSTTVTNEYALAVKAFKLTYKDVRNLVIYGFKRSFNPGSYQSKRGYVRQIIDYYEAIERRFRQRAVPRAAEPAAAAAAGGGGGGGR